MFNILIIIGLATSYIPGDGMCGKKRADGKPFKKTDWHIAHRYLPLGTFGTFCNLRNGLCVPVTVQDRGPFGSLHLAHTISLQKAQEVCKKNPRLIRWKKRNYYWCSITQRLPSNWQYRGMFDITQRVARAIALRSFDLTAFYYDKSRIDIQKMNSKK